MDAELLFLFIVTPLYWIRTIASDLNSQPELRSEAMAKSTVPPSRNRKLTRRSHSKPDADLRDQDNTGNLRRAANSHLSATGMPTLPRVYLDGPEQ